MSEDFRPAASWENLRFRAAMLLRLREFFDARGFLEVETPILSADTVVDRHLEPFWVGTGDGGREAGNANCKMQNANCKLSASDSQSLIPNPSAESPHPSPLPRGEGIACRRLWLQTSPEFAMKRLLAAGAGPIYQVARVFRQDEVGLLHNPEFTLVEWYQPGDDLGGGMTLTADLCETMLGMAQGASRSPSPGQRPGGAAPSKSPSVGPTGQPFAERLTYAEAFQRHVGVDPHTADGELLKSTARKLNIEAPASLATDDRDGWLDLLLVERIQPHLGVEGPTLLYDYPASQAALARVRHEQGKPPVAERFELYIRGVEIANGYHELLDPAELRARNAAVNRQRLADGKTALPEESRLLAAMESGLPSSVGVALGFDRLMMAALGVGNIAEVLAFPFDRA
jgi:elongation factor P--(R)-beta-lysine ligase